MRLLLPGLVLLVLALPGSARAATVYLAPGAVVVKGDAGEASAATITLTADSAVVDDPGGTLKVAPGCTETVATQATCPRTPGTDLVVDAGDGDDQITVTGASGGGRVLLDGGAGNDVLTGSEGPDQLQGGPGADELRGGGADDVLVGDDATGTIGADLLDGGDGRDQARWLDAGFLTVALSDPGADGRKGEEDRLEGIEDVRGAAGGSLIGDDGPNRLQLSAGTGLQLISGLGGDDVLLADPPVVAGDLILGTAKLDGGAGDDVLSSDYTLDTVCGLGRDVLLGPSVTVGDCELVALGAAAVETRVRVVRGRAVVRVVPNPFPARTVRSRARTLRIEDPESGKALALGRTRFPGRVPVAFAVPLTAEGRRVLAKRPSLTVNLLAGGLLSVGTAVRLSGG